MSTQKNHGPTKYANSNLNSVFAKSSTSTSVSSTGSAVSKYNGMLVLSKQRLRPSSTAAGPKLAVPKPVNLPSMRKEHAGNDPTTVLVPSGGTSSGWNKPEDSSAQTTDTNRAAGVTPGASWATNRTQSPAWAPTPSEAAKAAQLQPHGRTGSAALDRHLNPEEYPTLGTTSRTQSQPLPRRSPFHEANQDHLWTDDERNVPAAAPYKQSGHEWSRDADDDRYVSRTPWDSGKGSSGFFNPSRSFSTGELHEDYVPRRFDFDAPPPPPPPARRSGAAAAGKEGSRFAPGFDYYHDETGLFPPPPPPPGRPHDGISEKSEEEDLERDAFYETLDKVAAELQKRKEEAEKEKEKEAQAQAEAEAEAEAQALALAQAQAEAEALASPEPEVEPETLHESPLPQVKSLADAIKADLEDMEKPDAPRSEAASDTPNARSKLVIQPRKTQRELEYEEEEKRRKAAAAEKLRQLEERMERQRREKEEAEAKARAEEEAAKKAAAIALQPPSSQQSTPSAVAAPVAAHDTPEPSGLSTPTEEDTEAWGERGFKAEEEKPLVMEEDEEDAEPPTPAEPAPVMAESSPDASAAPGNAWQRGPPIQAAANAAVSMAARFGTFDDDLLEDITKAAQQQTPPEPKSKASPIPEAQPPQRSGQSSWRSQPKSEEPIDYDMSGGFDRGGRRGGRGGRGARGGRTPDSGTPRSRGTGYGTEIDARNVRGRGIRPDRGGRGNDRAVRPSREESVTASDAKAVVPDAAVTHAAAVEPTARVDTAPTTDQSTAEADGKARRPSNGRMNKDALVPPPSSSSISKAPGAGRGKHERPVLGKPQTPPTSAALTADSAAQAAAAVAAAVAGVTSSAAPPAAAPQSAPSSSNTSMPAPTLISPRASAPGLLPPPSPGPPGPQCRPLDSRTANPIVDIKVPAPIGPSAQPSPQPIARSPVISAAPTGLWAGPNIVKDIPNISLGPLTGNDSLHLGSGLPPAVKPVQLGAPMQGFDRQIGPRQGGGGNKDLGGGPEALTGDVLGNGMPKFPENLMDMVQAQHKQPQGAPIPFPPPPGAGNSMVRPLGPNSFPFHSSADSNPGPSGPGQGGNTLNLWGPTPLNFGQHPAGSMHHASSQPSPSAISNALESFYPGSMFPTTSLPMHPPATPNSPNPHANPALMNPVLAGLHQYSQHFPNLYAPHTQFGTMGTTFGQFPNQAFIPTGKQPDWSTPNPIGIPSTNPVLNPALVRPPGLDAMLPGAYPMSAGPNQAGIASDPVSHYSSGMGPSLGAPQQGGLQPGVQGMGNNNPSAGFSNMMPGPKQGPTNMPMKLSQGSSNSMMMGGHPGNQQNNQLQTHGKQEPAPINKGVPQLPDDVFPGMEPSSSMTMSSMQSQSHANGNGKVDSQPSSKQSTPPGLAPPQAAQQAAQQQQHQQQQQQHQHMHHHSHQPYGGANERQPGLHHEQGSQHARGSSQMNGGGNMPPTGPKHGGRGRGSNPSGSSGGRSDRMGGRGSNRTSRSPVRSSENSGGRTRGGSGSARSSGAGSANERGPTGAPSAVVAAAAAAAVAALNTSGPTEGMKQGPGSANPGPPPQTARYEGGGRGGRGRGGPGRGPGGRSRGPPGGPKTMYVPKGTIPPNAHVKTEAG